MRPCRDPKRCRHCGHVRCQRARGLCNPCYAIPEILAKYPPSQETRPDIAEPDERPEWVPGQPQYRCCWCMRFRCDGYLRLCGECLDDYNRRSVGMPQEKMLESWSTKT